jgi:hypothetical protein
MPGVYLTHIGMRPFHKTLRRCDYPVQELSYGDTLFYYIETLIPGSPDVHGLVRSEVVVDPPIPTFVHSRHGHTYPKRTRFVLI